tara:strand:+ start:537 stop:701 length:165 start_codon:yes stop_codon:yes gene_type:complete
MNSAEVMSVNKSLADTLLQYIAQQQQQLFNFIESVAVMGDLGSCPLLSDVFGVG